MEQRAWSKEHGAKGMEQRAWSKGHGAKGMEYRVKKGTGIIDKEVPHPDKSGFGMT